MSIIIIMINEEIANAGMDVEEQESTTTTLLDTSKDTNPLKKHKSEEPADKVERSRLKCGKQKFSGRGTLLCLCFGVFLIICGAIYDSIRKLYHSEIDWLFDWRQLDSPRNVLLLNLLKGPKKTIHIIPHSHTDLGWFSTIDEMF